MAAAPALLEMGLVAVGHFCLRDGAAAPRWFASLAEAAEVYVGLRKGAAVASQWGTTMAALRSRAGPCAPERPAGMLAGWQSDVETREAARRARELGKLAGGQEQLRMDLTQQRDVEKAAWLAGRAAEGPCDGEWEARLRAAAVYAGPPASVAVGERDLGLADGAEMARGPHVVFDMQRDIASFGGEEGWLQRKDVGEDGWQEGWQQRADAAREGLKVDEEGYVAWSESGARLTAEEAKARGPAVEMATRARLALGDGVAVERGEPVKRRGGGGRDGRGGEEEEEGGGGVFVNVQAARTSLVAMTEWCAKIEAQAVFTLDGTRTVVGGRGTGGGRGGGGGGSRGGGGGGGGGDDDSTRDRSCPTCRVGGGALAWARCFGCEREVHRRCCVEKGELWCLECAGASDEELFEWANELRRQAEAVEAGQEREAERGAAEAREAEAAEAAEATAAGSEVAAASMEVEATAAVSTAAAEAAAAAAGGGSGDGNGTSSGCGVSSGGGGGGFCQKGHQLRRAGEEEGEWGEEEGLVCNGGCSRALVRGTGWWCCEACDYDVCDACHGVDGGGGRRRRSHTKAAEEERRRREREGGEGGGGGGGDRGGGGDGGGGGGEGGGGGGGGGVGSGGSEGGGGGDGGGGGGDVCGGGSEFGRRSRGAGGGGDAEGKEGERLVAAWAAVRHDGVREMGALSEGVRDNYMAEMAAQLAVAASAGVRRVVIVFDATSPPEVLRRFMGSCWRKRQRFYRRDWLDTWRQQLQAFEVVVFLWQTSHVGAPVNEWADQAAGVAALAGLEEAEPVLLAVEYASLELEQADGQLTRGGPRAAAAAAAQREAERRLAVGSGSAQMVEECDLELPRLPERLVNVAEAVLCGRAQIGDARRFCGRVARRMAAELGCPFGCGCGFTWHDVAFECKGELLVRLRGAWMAMAEEARKVLAARKPHSQWRRMQGRGAAEGGKALRHGSAEEVELRRLVGGAVLRTGEGEVDGCSRVRAVVGRAVSMGLELQAAGRAATASFEWRVRKEVRRHAVARRYAVRWREAARHGGPRRVAALRDAEFVKSEAEEALVLLEEEGWLESGLQSEAGGLKTLEHWAKLGEACAEMWARARSIRAISPACALREWRWLAGLRLWRWNVAMGGSANRGVGAAAGWRRVPPPGEWDRVMQAALGELLGRAKFGVEVITMDVRYLDFRAHEARRRWADGGGRRRLEWLRRWEVDEGREADPRGRWRVARVMDVRRPMHRHGRQLEVQVEWAGVDTRSGAAWSVEWVALAWCTGDVREEARRLEGVKYPTARAERAPLGSRKSPRLLDDGKGGVGGGGSEGSEGSGDEDGEVGGGRGGGGSGDGGRGGGDRSGGDGGGARVRAPAAAAANPVGAARAAARAVARLNPTGRHKRRRPDDADDGEAGAEGADGDGEAGASESESDDLANLLDDVHARAQRREEMLRRADEEADALMDNGVRVHPYFRGRARQASVAEADEEAEAEAGDRGPRCQAGHAMHRRETGAAGLTCDGGCGRALRRGTKGWCCVECDFDVCDACGGR